MAEWTSVLAVFWLLWALDGIRFGARRLITVIGGARGRARLFYGGFSAPGVLPTSWRIVASDVPAALSPEGICNRPVGALGRPAEAPAAAQAWRWEDVREVGVAAGGLFINRVRFCDDTRHVPAPQVLKLAGLPAPAREAAIRAIMRQWFRPAQLKRRALVLAARTRAVTTPNTLSLLLFAAITVYHVGEFATRLSMRWSTILAAVILLLLLVLLGLHFAAIFVAWRAGKRLRPLQPNKRSPNLLSALLLPPQAWRLRALLGEGFFPPQHPLAIALAFVEGRARTQAAFDVVADLRWPVGEEADDALARRIVAWHRTELARTVEARLKAEGIAVDELLRAPLPDAPASCRYCPRCRDQFTGETTVCPHRVALQPLARKRR